MNEAQHGVAIVTGASSGIGRLLSERLAALGRYRRIVVVARRAELLETLRSAAPTVVLPMAGDLCDPAFRSRIVPAAEAEGPVELLVNNAGYGTAVRFEEQDPRDIQRMLDLNVAALVDLTHDAVTVMRPRGRGRILQVSSLAATLNVPYFSVYVGTKAFVNGFVDTLRHELRGTGVRVSAVCPGSVSTGFNETAFGGRTTRMIEMAGEPPERVVRTLLRHLDSNPRRIYPTLSAWLTRAGQLAFPWLFRLVMGRVVRRVINATLPPASGAKELASPSRHQ
jgi:short-subunit dehydrogenase